VTPLNLSGLNDQNKKKQKILLCLAAQLLADVRSALPAG